MKSLCFALLFVATLASAQTWTVTINKSDITNISQCWLLRDARLLCYANDTGEFRFVTPDAFGSYINGTWSVADSFPPDYKPSSAANGVLMDGRLYFFGGEYNHANGKQQLWMNRAFIFDPYDTATGKWKEITPPAKLTHIGDSPSSTLDDGTVLFANVDASKNWWSFDRKTEIFTEVGDFIAPNNDEITTVKLPNGTVLVPDAQPNISCGPNSTEIYTPATQAWACGPQMVYRPFGGDHDFEDGPSLLMYNGVVLSLPGYAGGYLQLLDTTTMTWSVGPYLTLTGDDTTAVMETSGKAVLDLGDSMRGCHFMEFDPATLQVSDMSQPPQCPTQGSKSTHLLPLPTGQLWLTWGGVRAEVWTPRPGVFAPAAPSILGLASFGLRLGSVNNVLFGYQLNGLSEANAGQGDDYQGATNYPLVRFTDSVGHVWYGRTHDESTHSIAPGTIGYTRFDLPSGMGPGSYSLQVVTNGITSNSIQVSVR